jgi:hypothetical protein
MHCNLIHAPLASAARHPSLASAHDRNRAATFFEIMRATRQKALDDFCKLIDNRLPGGSSSAAILSQKDCDE